MGAISGPQWKAKARSRRATATPGRGRAWGAWGPFRAPSRRRTRNRGAPRLRRAASKRGGHGGHFGPPVEGEREIEARHGYAGPRPSEGGMGVRAPSRRRTRNRGAPRLRRAASKRGGHGGHFGPPVEGEREIEARHGCAGPRPSEGGMGAISGPQWKANARSRRATAAPGRVQARGAWGPFRAPSGRRTRERGAPRLRRARAKRGGHGGHFGPPVEGERESEARHGCAGPAPSEGGMGAISGPQWKANARARRATAAPGPRQ